MGLDVVVGGLAQDRQSLSDEEFAPLFQPFEMLNQVLADAGVAPHHEPLGVEEGDVFEAQMWGYNGLHMIRRLAAHWAINGELPQPVVCDPDDEDPVLEKLYTLHNEFLFDDKSPSRLSRFPKPKPAPAFPHLLLHSDCEGFYLPRWMTGVVFDRADPQREGVGCMVGSAAMLWEECSLLASLIDLPDGLDLQHEQLWEYADMPAREGPLWQQYGVEAYGLTVLMRACEASARLGAVVEFV